MNNNDYGFYLNELNNNTFLWNALKRNNIENAVNYFHDLPQKNQYKKWLCPVYCDISLLDNYEFTLSKLHNTIEANQGFYFFDLCIEAIPYNPIDSYLSQKFKSFHQMLESHAINPEKVFFVHANLVGDKYYDDWRKKMGINYRIGNPILTHQYSLSGFSEPFKAYFGRNNLLQKNVELVEKSIQQNIKRKYHFTCLALRPRFHRTVVMLHLLERGHFQKGIISYFGEAFGNKSAVTVESNQLTYNMIKQLPSSERLLKVWLALEKIGTVAVDTTLTTIREKGWAPKELGFFPRPYFEDTSSLNARSYFEIVSETHFTNETCLYLTEKTIWAIVSLQPFILVGSPYTLRYLRELGFQTFSPYIDESYDEVCDPLQRIEFILKQIDYLCSLTLDQLHELYNALWPRLLHNYYHYFNHSQTLSVEEINKRILAPINHA